MKLRIGSLFVFLVVVGFGWSAEACERCDQLGYNNWEACSSGWSSPYQWCYGGFGIPCNKGGDCYDANGRKREPERDGLSVDDPCPTCVEAEPDQGFMLRTAPTESSATSAKSD